MALAARGEQTKKRSVIQMSTVQSKALIAEMLHHGENAKVDPESQRHAKKAKVGAESQRRLGEELAKLVGAELKRHTKPRSRRGEKTKVAELQCPAEKAKVGSESQVRHGDDSAKVGAESQLRRGGELAKLVGAELKRHTKPRSRHDEKTKVAELQCPAEKAEVSAESQVRHGDALTKVGAESQLRRGGGLAKVGAELKRHPKSTNLRPYVRSSTHKLRWTRELHESFMDAVNELGGKIRATPKQIVGLMGRDDVTTAQVKSHLQMLRLSRINTEEMPVTAELVDPMVLNPIVVSKVVKRSRVSKALRRAPERLSVKEQHEVFRALQLLKTGKIDAAQKLLQGLRDFEHFVSRAPNSDVGSVSTHEFMPVGDNNSDSRTAGDDIALDLSIGTCVKSPKPTPMFRFSSPDTAADPRLILELALAVRSEKSS